MAEKAMNKALETAYGELEQLLEELNLCSGTPFQKICQLSDSVFAVADNMTNNPTENLNMLGNGDAGLAVVRRGLLIDVMDSISMSIEEIDRDGENAKKLKQIAEKAILAYMRFFIDNDGGQVAAFVARCFEAFGKVLLPERAKEIILKVMNEHPDLGKCYYVADAGAFIDGYSLLLNYPMIQRSK